jgi:hypothetical protein
VIVLYSEMFFFFVFYVVNFFIHSLYGSLTMYFICISNCVYIPSDSTATNADQNGLCRRNCTGNVANEKRKEDCT